MNQLISVVYAFLIISTNCIVLFSINVLVKDRSTQLFRSKDLFLNYFLIEEEYIKWIKSDSKDIHNVYKNVYFK